MPNVKSVEPTHPFEAGSSRLRRHAVVTGEEPSVASPALRLQEHLQVAMTRPEARAVQPGGVAVVVLVGLGVVGLCLVFWTAVASMLVSALA